MACDPGIIMASFLTLSEFLSVMEGAQEVPEASWADHDDSGPRVSRETCPYAKGNIVRVSLGFGEVRRAIIVRIYPQYREIRDAWIPFFGCLLENKGGKPSKQHGKTFGRMVRHFHPGDIHRGYNPNA